MTHDNHAPQHTHFMEIAHAEALRAYAAGEVPVGAVVVAEGKVIARAHNRVQALQRATAHAELLALEAAFAVCGAKYLPSCTLYVTLEPCVMCAGACFWAQLQEVVFGASDPKRGYQQIGSPLLHPKTCVIGAIEASRSTALLQRFFQGLRAKDPHCRSAKQVVGHGA